jgi:hypothetical protein
MHTRRWSHPNRLETTRLGLGALHIDIDVIDRLSSRRQEQLVELFSSAWWTADRRLDAIEGMLAETSVLVGLVDRSSDRLVGFARAITDRTFLALVLGRG